MSDTNTRDDEKDEDIVATIYAALEEIESNERDTDAHRRGCNRLRLIIAELEGLHPQRQHAHAHVLCPDDSESVETAQ